MSGGRVNTATPRRSGEWPLTLPSMVWLAVLVLIPALIVFVVAFRSTDPYGGVGARWTLDTLRDLARESYLLIGWRTVYLSLLTTTLCLLLATPMAYFMARAPRKWRDPLLLLVVVPFWTS